MKGLFYIKRHAHRMVNVLFYGGFFIAGYIVGKGFNFKIGIIKELLSW